MPGGLLRLFALAFCRNPLDFGRNTLIFGFYKLQVTVTRQWRSAIAPIPSGELYVTLGAVCLQKMHLSVS